MSGLLLTLPFVGGDFVNLAGSDFRDIRLDPGTGTPVVATLDLPSTHGLEGYYNRGTLSGTHPTTYDDLAERICAAFGAVSPGTWFPTWYTDPDGVTRVAIGTSYTPAGDVHIYWSHADTTFPAEWAGWDSGTDVTSPGGAFTSPYQPGRLWRHDIPELQRSAGGRRVDQALGLTGREETRIYGGWTEWDLKFAVVPGPGIFLSDVAKAATGSVMVPSLSVNDPNYAFEALWSWMGKRRPMRLLEDETIPETYRELVPIGGEFLSDFRRGIKSVGKGSPPYYNLAFKALGYVP